MKSKRIISFLLLLSLFSSCSSNGNSSISLSSSSIIPQVSVIDNDEKTTGSLSSGKRIDSSQKESSISSKEKDSSQKSSSSSKEVLSYWSSLDFSTYGNTFRAALQSLIKKTGNRTVGYSANNTILAQSDKALNGNGAIPFYHADSESVTSWNKEHVWPNSRGAGKTGIGSDPHMLRPTNTKDNSSRGNSFYGEEDDNNTWDPASFGYGPARGEAARIIFYVATKYYGTCGSGGTSKGNKPVELSNNPNDNKDLHTMGRLDRLIQWNQEYPATAQEKRRNEYLYQQGFGRNPFIDNPDFANYIWDEKGIRTSGYSILNNQSLSCSIVSFAN